MPAIPTMPADDFPPIGRRLGQIVFDNGYRNLHDFMQTYRLNIQSPQEYDEARMILCGLRDLHQQKWERWSPDQVMKSPLGMTVYQRAVRKKSRRANKGNKVTKKSSQPVVGPTGSRVMAPKNAAHSSHAVVGAMESHPITSKRAAHWPGWVSWESMWLRK